EDQLANSITDTEQGSYLALDPELGQKVLDNLSRSIEKMAGMNIQPILLCSPVVRRHLRKLTERFLPNLVVLSHNEITPTTQLNVMGEVGLSNAG
ncbi:MAG: FHIPEP family type III secretion protein, partial [Deltaproteobacteria bacterium]|nr:FHIPEP family type III secretion protein [Deltaproteobacteria bacterium]